ncbi:MAG: transglycosylase domain-containing protein [Cytophagales bacterium]|nr:transglycosylase domain-containing protein [Cytophagales bacterium]
MTFVFRFILALVVALLALQLFFFVRIVQMRWIAPESTTFERSNIYQIAITKPEPWTWHWRQTWTPYERISVHLKRAIIASEDATFTDHDGVDWDAIEKAWEKNQRAEKSAEKMAEKNKPKASLLGKKSTESTKPAKPPKTVGGSTITQQLAKNLFLSGERTYLRKAQEYVLVVMLEAVLSKERIYEIYLNHVEWGEGVFGAQAAAQRYFRHSAANLSASEASLLAVMLPRPKYFERRFASSGYLQSRAATIQARMGGVDIP